VRIVFKTDEGSAVRICMTWGEDINNVLCVCVRIGVSGRVEAEAGKEKSNATEEPSVSGK
jgi:hypothetical protein